MTWRRLFFDIASAMRRMAHDRSGATVIEYGLIATLIAGALVVGYFATGEDLAVLFQEMADLIEDLHNRRGL